MMQNLVRLCKEQQPITTKSVTLKGTTSEQLLPVTAKDIIPQWCEQVLLHHPKWC